MSYTSSAREEEQYPSYYLSQQQLNMCNWIRFIRVFNGQMLHSILSANINTIQTPFTMCLY